MESDPQTKPNGIPADPIEDSDVIGGVAAGDDDDEDKTEGVEDDEENDEPDVDETDTGTDDVPE